MEPSRVILIAVRGKLVLELDEPNEPQHDLVVEQNEPHDISALRCPVSGHFLKWRGAATLKCSNVPPPPQGWMVRPLPSALAPERKKP